MPDKDKEDNYDDMDDIEFVKSMAQKNYMFMLYGKIGNSLIGLDDHECSFEKYYPIGEERHYKTVLGEVIDLKKIPSHCVAANFSKDECVSYILNELLYAMFYLFVFSPQERGTDGLEDQIKEACKMYMTLSSLRGNKTYDIYKCLNSLSKKELKGLTVLISDAFENLL